MSTQRGLSSLTAPKKQQQSISSFFTPSSTPKTSNAALSPLATSTPALLCSKASTTLEEEDADPYRDNGAIPSLGLEIGTSEARPTLKRQRDQNNEGDIKRRRITFEDDSEERAMVAERQQSNGLSSKVHRNGAQPSRRTSKYLFGSTEIMEEDQDEEVIRQKEVLHQRFVKKLGRPDSLAEIRRRNHVLEDSVPGDEENDNEESEDSDGLKIAANGKKTIVKKVTPMVKQMLDIKRKNLDTLIVMEVGYKFKFYGEDARIAAKELSIVCIPGKYRFDDHPSEAHYDYYASASIPVHRLHVHVRRLVAAGHKVGIVRQLETAALKKVGDNRNTPFVRELTNLYTKGTYVDDAEALDTTVAGPNGGAPATGHLLCITETNANGWGTDEKVYVAIVAVLPATGDIIYDDFEDGFMRSEIETRLLHIAPCEFLIVGQLSKNSERLIQHLSNSKANVFGDKARVERVERPKTMAAHAFSHISRFYAEKLASPESSDESQGRGILDKVHKLSEQVTICLSAMITHLADYGLQHVFDLTKNFQSFSARSHMLLNGNTLSSLEIYRNQTDNTEKGSLLWVLDRTQTRFGQRLLRKWVGRPLLEIQRLQDRIAAVEELRNGAGTSVVERIRSILTKMKSDLEKSLIRVYYKKCTRPELVNMLQTLQKAASEFAHVKHPADAGFESTIINEAIAKLPQVLEDVVAYLDQINLQAAKDNDKYEFFRVEHETDKVTHHKVGIASSQFELDDYRKIAAERLKTKKVDYVTWNKLDFLIEVDNTQLKNVPASWAKISGTKKLSRFHTPEVIKMIRERDQHKESLSAACDDAFDDLLTDMSTKYQAFHDCIQSLATLDCLLSLAEVAAQPGYVRADFTNETCISVDGGRHPMVEQLLLESYVPNNIELSASDIRSLLITGPNMGGKSSYVRQVALIAIMGQIGSYVPATSARLGMLDAIFTRMGAFDNIMSGKSTFMVELSETADILKQATPRSLVILDELGRGTSTHDGVAIAEAVLQHIVHETKSLLLFITHYQSLAKIAGGVDDKSLRNMHMRFTEGTTSDGDGGGQDITFLYELGDGVAHRSYGLNVAKLASVPHAVLDVAAIKSKELEVNVQTAKLAGLLQVLKKLGSPVEAVETADIVGMRLHALVEGIEQL